MYARATCVASIYRGSTKDEGGDLKPNNTVTGLVVSSVVASIVERDSRVWDNTTRTPRVVRIVEGRVGSNVDVKIDDRVKDVTHDEWFVVTNVTTPRAAGKTPDTVLGLKRVG